MIDRQKLLARKRRYYAKNRVKADAYNRKWCAEHPGQRRAHCRRYYKRNTDAIRARNKAYWKKAYTSRPTFRLANVLRARFHDALNGRRKSASTLSLLGCSIENLWIYLESKFQDGMTRENYGKVWHIDHIMPCAIFDLSKPEHQKRCFHFSNLQPLFAAENQRKYNKVPNELENGKLR
jgi:hypothetical protein